MHLGEETGLRLDSDALLLVYSCSRQQGSCYAEDKKKTISILLPWHFACTLHTLCITCFLNKYKLINHTLLCGCQINSNCQLSVQQYENSLER